MRAFSFHRNRFLYPLRSAACLTAAWLALGTPRAALAQWPGEVHVTVVDRFGQSAVGGATVEVAGTGTHHVTDARGSLVLRGLSPGTLTIRVVALGYHPRELALEARNGHRSRLTVELSPKPLTMRGLSVASAATSTGLHAFSRREIEGSGARTLGDLVARAPGVVVRRDVTGGAQEISIRGSGPDAVLVLVDGAPLNDPVTGVADLSLIDLSGVERVTVLPGARSVTYGPRALAGVVEVERRSAGAPISLAAATGSLGLVDASVEAGRTNNRGSQRVSAGFKRVDGGFSYTLPPEVGGGDAVRTNADALAWNAAAALDRTWDHHRLGARIEIGRTERGLPGKAFQQTDSSRQEVARAQVSVNWSASRPSDHWSGHVTGVWEEVGFRDPDPPAGRPFDDSTRLLQVTANVEGSRRWDREGTVTLGYGARLEHLGVDAATLSAADGAKGTTHAGAHLRSEWRPGGPWTLSAGGRVDAGGGDGPVLSHALSVGYSRGAVSAALSHRSAYSPPTLADQFFREGVGVRANPDLMPERVPSEWEFTTTVHQGAVRLGGSAYIGDVRGLIVWLPDFQFIWSPRNTDVKRRGVDLWTELSLAAGWRLGGRYAYTRATYDRNGPDSVQLAYRPRHTAGADGSWTAGSWRLALGGDFTGTRYPVPARVNALDPFWSWRFSVSRQWTVAGVTAETSLHIDRLLDKKNTLIFAFPSPGRTLRVSMRLGL